MSVARRGFVTGSSAAATAMFFGRLPGLAAQARQPAPAAPVFTPIRRNVGFFTARGGTIGYLLSPVSPAGIVVVDSQFADSGKLCVDGLAQQSGQRPIDFLINTHHHGDHTGGNIAFKGRGEEGRRAREGGRAHAAAARAAGASDTTYIFGHAGGTQPVTGSRADLTVMRDHLTALLAFVTSAKAGGQSRETIAAMRDPLKGFEAHGAVSQAVLSAAYGELFS